MISNNANPHNVEQLRVPPHSLAAEESVLAAIMVKNENLDVVASILSENDFYSRANRTIYGAICEIMGNAQVADIATIPDYLRAKGKLEDAGGDTYIYGLARSVASAAGLTTYAQTVRQRAMLREAIAAANDIQEQCYNSTGHDAIEILGSAESRIGEVSERLLTKVQDYSIDEAMRATVTEIEQRLKSGKEIAGISTGLPDLDARLNGLEAADMIVVAARPSMGKTTLAMNMVTTEALRDGGRPIVFSMEMPKQQLMYKMLSSLGQIPISALQQPNKETGGMNDILWSKTSGVMAKLRQKNMEIIDDAYMTIPRMRLEIRRFKKRFGNPTLIMADYLQLIRGTTKTDNRTNEISEISRGIKALAKEFNCPFVVLSQLSRNVESRNNKRPVNSDLRESGQIEQDADKIIFIYRDDVYNPNSSDRGLAELNVTKCRMGQIGMVGSAFRGEFSQFCPLAHGQQIVGEEGKPKAYSDKFEVGE
ncbi:replicative DNA helicase [Alteromonas pelagimontana]|uniref:Replicative DNA helicase n=1 Tax=Alteromonas pelagimontana TaxID=1858656 RepID=A0A6M4M8V2_9ALTE|nr:replicative DNA helicase [Alteromonas pelagimontana]QJR79631.1 replicative DNA helicase [Alteromonas pelagimontana]